MWGKKGIFLPNARGIFRDFSFLFVYCLSALFVYSCLCMKSTKSLLLQRSFQKLNFSRIFIIELMCPFKIISTAKLGLTSRIQKSVSSQKVKLHFASIFMASTSFQKYPSVKCFY